MNKSAIEKFAVWARRKLISEITYKAGLLGITDKGIAEPLPQSSNDLQLFDVGTKDYVQVQGTEIVQRNALVSEIKQRERKSDYKTAFESLVEEVAYTWFNRLIAVRFMEVNDYLPSRVRVLSSENSAKSEPDLVTNPFESDLTFTPYEQDRVIQLKDENKLDELFGMLFIKQCNKLHEILPRLFEPTNDYTELLLTISFTDKDGVVYHLTHDIPEDDFNVEKQGQVEIIGWMYQYYNIEPKKQVFANLKNNKKISKEDIPAATQLFTPDWIVRYMVENSLGRLWVEGHPNDALKGGWKYYLEEAEQEPDVQAQLEEIRKDYKNLNPEDIKIIDPCMGSGHILVYAFDVLMQIYESCGWGQREAAQSIVENNLYGLDIDERAAQLTYFAVMMKARQYDRRFLGRGIEPRVYVVCESNDIDQYTLDYFVKGDSVLKAAMDSIMREMHDAKEYGSILNVTPVDFAVLYARLDEVYADNDFNRENALDNIAPLVQVAEVLAQKYDVVVTNPPYMGASNMNAKLNGFLKNNYTEYKSDFFSVFVVRCSEMAKASGKLGFFTPYVWMFIQSYEKMRQYLYNRRTIETLIQFEYSAFEEATVPVCTFAFSNYHVNKKACYLRLTEFRGGMEVQRQKTLEAIANHNCGYYYEQSAYYFSKIPGSPVAFWLSQAVVRSFVEEIYLRQIAQPKVGIQTGDNNRFLRFWFEVNNFEISFYGRSECHKWFPMNKGGEYRRWYGNQEYVVNWENDGFELKNFKDEHGKLKSRPQNLDCIFHPSISWSMITSGDFSVRYFPDCFMANVAGISCYPKENDQMYLLALLNTNIVSLLVKAINPTLNLNAGDVEKIPIIFSCIEKVNLISSDCVNLSKQDWDSYETSWDFKKHPLLRPGSALRQAYIAWQQECNARFAQLKANEEELNRIFIDIYGLQDELTHDVQDKDVTVHYIVDSKDDIPESLKGSNYVRTKRDEIVSLISYAVGCMLGRYSLDVEGLAYAGGEWDSGKYATFVPDDDNCIPITDEEYFKDDIVGRFVEFVKVVYGEQTLEENLEFIANALGNKGNTSRDVIRNYFLNDFIGDHIKTYQKRPIYWLFDSGKQNGFKALVYMHRWNADTIGNVRVEYLHRAQRVYESEIARMQETIDNSENSREIAAAEKRKDKLTKQLKEVKDYDEKIAHLALSRIDIDLDDGVKVNYDKVQTTPGGENMGILTKIK